MIFEHNISSFSRHEADSHIRDVFDILSYLQSIPHPDGTLLMKFLLFCQYRAFHLLGFQMLDFSQRWDQLPFKVMKDHMSSIAGLPGLKESFVLPIDPVQIRILSKYGVHGEPLPLKRGPNDEQYRYTLTVNNLSAWVQMFIGVWEMLEGELLNLNLDGKTAGMERLPDPSRMPFICLYIGTLHLVRPILKHLLSTRGNWALIRALRNAGMLGIIGCINPQL